MPLTEHEVRRRLQSTLAAVAPEISLDAGAIRWVDSPYPGFAYGLRLGQANALLFMPVVDIEDEEWEHRLRLRLQDARRYMEQFPLARVGR